MRSRCTGPRGVWRAALVALVMTIVTPSIAAAQAGASITGVVRDTSGAVLPGVTVEAASPALIEKVRSVVTDGAGQYRVEALRSGAYSVTFTLAGFNTFKRDGIELTGSFVATVNAELKVGSVAETVTVTGQSPLVDVQASKQQRVIEKEVLDSIPTGRTGVTAGVLIPGIVLNSPDVGGANNLPLTAGQLQIHGSILNDYRQMIDGLTTGNGEGGAWASGFVVNMTATQEVELTYASGSAEQPTGGVISNLIPREGGNALKGSFYGTAVNNALQNSNYSQDLADRGVRTPGFIKLAYDYNPGLGGALKRDRLWFYGSARWVKNSNYVPGIFYNKNEGNPNAWTYDPDLSRPAFLNNDSKSVNLRLTWQATARNKFSVFHDQQAHCYCSGVTAFKSPESAVHLTYRPEDFTTASWTAPLTGRLLLEARSGLRRERFTHHLGTVPGDAVRQLIDVTEQGGSIPGLQYRGSGLGIVTQPYWSNHGINWNTLASLSYITGRHAFKTGITETFLQKDENYRDNDYHVSYRFLNGVPNLITQRATPFDRQMKEPYDLGIYAQDRWTVDRMTLNLGVRYDTIRTYFPAQSIGPGLLVPNRNLTFEETPQLNFKDVVPRLGAAYDLFGNGKTALKTSLNKYNIALGITFAPNFTNGVLDPISRLANTATRSWTDANGNFKPDCDLTNPLAQDNRASGGDFCGTMSDVNFGKPTGSIDSDPATATGTGNRPYEWEFSTSVQHELSPRVSLNVGYFRRWAGNFTVVDNRALEPSDFTAFMVTAPTDPRLPGGGGAAIGPFYDRNPETLSRPPQNINTLASNYGNQIRHFNGVDMSANLRFPGRIVVQGGLSTGRTSTDNCEILARVPEFDPLGIPYCHQDTDFLTQVKFLGTYTLPKVDVLLSGTFQSVPGPQISASRVYANALVRPSLGRDLSGGAQNVTVNLVAPGTLFGDRLNQLDLRFGKILKYRRTRTLISLDIYNAFNSSAALTENPTYVNSTLTGWRVPTSLVMARFAKFSVQFDF